MISFENGVFCLGGEGWSYLFRIGGYGQLEHIHFGAAVTAADAQALAGKNVLGWGASVVLDDGDAASCPDSMPLEWSGSGRGDYRESPIELEDEKGAIPTRFVYRSHRIGKGCIPMEGGLPQAEGALETLEVTMEDESGRFGLKLYWSVFPMAVTRRAVLENRSGGTVHIRKLMSFSLDLMGKFDISTLDGGWIAETHKHTVPLGRARVVNESVTGFSSHRHNPGFMLSQPGANEEWGRVYGINLIYSGNHYAGAQRSLQGLSRVMQGISPNNFRWPLAAGESFSTPEAVLVWSDGGFGGMSRRMHSFVNRHIVPEYWRFRTRPVLYNDWEGCMFDFDQKRLVSLARRAKKLGCELFVLDDGWFGNRNSDTAGLGDYSVNPKKLPEGMAGIANKVNELGMQFGLWFEPEAVNPDSDLYRAHPDWVLSDGLEPLLARHELHLDLTKKEVRDYIVDSVSAVLDSANISYVKWDMNRHSVALGAKAHEYILGLYEVQGRIFRPRPHILLENCASGGNRFDLGMLRFGAQIWASDDTDAIERLDIQTGLSYLYPLSSFGSHVSATPNAQTLRTAPMSTRGNVAFFGVLGYELDLAHLVPVEEDEIRNQIRFYKKHRKEFQFGAFRRLDVEEGVGWQVSLGGSHVAGIFHRLVHAAPGYERLAPRGLKSGAKYRVTSRPQTLRVGQFGALMSHVVPVEVNPNGALLRAADRHYVMPDAGQSFEATGAALGEGWGLVPLYCGTGYDKGIRVQSDFGSNVFEITEVEE